MNFGAVIGKKIGRGNIGTIYVLEGLIKDNNQSPRKSSRKSGSRKKLREKFLVKEIRFIDPESPEIKVLPKFMRSKFTVENQIKELRNEIAIQQIAASAGIAPKILSYTDEYIVMQYIKGQTLNNFIKSHSKHEVTEIMKKTQRLIDTMHGLGIKHNDLHGENILVYQRRPYIIDFGMSEHSPNFKQKDFENDYIQF